MTDDGLQLMIILFIDLLLYYFLNVSVQCRSCNIFHKAVKKVLTNNSLSLLIHLMIVRFTQTPRSERLIIFFQFTIREKQQILTFVNSASVLKLLLDRRLKWIHSVSSLALCIHNNMGCRPLPNICHIFVCFSLQSIKRGQKNIWNVLEKNSEEEQNKCAAEKAAMGTPRQFGAWQLGEGGEYTSESQLADWQPGRRVFEPIAQGTSDCYQVLWDTARASKAD